MTTFISNENYRLRVSLRAMRKTLVGAVMIALAVCGCEKTTDENKAQETRSPVAQTDPNKDSPHSLEECLASLPSELSIEEKLTETVMTDKFGSVPGVSEAIKRMYELKGADSLDFVADVFDTFLARDVPDCYKAGYAIEILGKIAEKQPEKVLPYFQRAIQHKNVFIRCMTVKASPEPDLYLGIVEQGSIDSVKDVRHWAYDWAYKKRSEKYMHIYKMAQRDQNQRECHKANCFLAEEFQEKSTVPYFINCLKKDYEIHKAFRYLDEVVGKKFFPRIKLVCGNSGEAFIRKVRAENEKKILRAKETWFEWWQENKESYQSLDSQGQ